MDVFVTVWVWWSLPLSLYWPIMMSYTISLCRIVNLVTLLSFVPPMVDILLCVKYFLSEEPQLTSKAR